MILTTYYFLIIKLKNADPKPLDLKFFKFNPTIARSPFINLRGVCCRHKLRKGQYCLVPSTYDPGEEGEFLIRMFSEKAVPSGWVQDSFLN